MLNDPRQRLVLDADVAGMAPEIVAGFRRGRVIRFSTRPSKPCDLSPVPAGTAPTSITQKPGTV
jgi:hypothetical protein